MKRIITTVVALLLFVPQIAAALCVQGDCKNGQGTVVLPDGRKYVGEFNNGIRTGRGLMTFPDGTKYLGDWMDDKPHGKGTLSSEGKYEYAGEFADGVRHGQGTLETVDGKKYSGQWQNDVPYGMGKIIYPDGGMFVGQFVNGRRNGEGEATYADGSKYIGQWSNDLPNGRGTKIYANGERYTGEFKNGLMHGKGMVEEPDGSRYSGQWQGDVLVKKEEIVPDEQLASAVEIEEYIPAVVEERPAADSQVTSRDAAAPESKPSDPEVKIAITGADYAGVNQNGVYMRSGPSTEYRIIQSVSRGFPVKIIGQKDKWSQVRDFVGQEGWVYTPLLDSNNSVIVKVSKVNIRSGPGLGYGVVDQAGFGSVLQVIDIKGDWYMVSTIAGVEGWLNTELVWPVEHEVLSSREISGSATAGPQEDPGPEKAVGPSIQEPVVESRVIAAPPVDAEAPMAIPVVRSEYDSRKPEEVEPLAAADVKDTAVSPPAASLRKLGYSSIAQNGRGANIRSEPSLSAEVLRSVPAGFPVLVLERQEGWALVEDFRERKGWVYGVLLSDPVTVVVKVGKGNLRSGPSLIDPIIAKLDYGVVMFLDETRGEWIKVRNNEGFVGWLHRDIVWP